MRSPHVRGDRRLAGAGPGGAFAAGRWAGGTGLVRDGRPEPAVGLSAAADGPAVGWSLAAGLGSPAGRSYAPPVPAAPDDARAVFGLRIRAARQGRGWSQKQLADLTGFDRKSVSRLETGAYSPSLDRILVLARALDVPVTELVAGLSAPPSP